MRNDLPISKDKKFKYSITFQSFDEESLEAGETNDRGYEVEDDTDTIGDILQKANTTYGIYMPVSFGIWESTEPDENIDFFEKGIRKYYALHITNEDGTEISQEESDFISFLLSDGRFHINKFRDYEFGGIVLGTLALGIGVSLIAYLYLKDKKETKKLQNNRAKSVTHIIKGKERKFPIKDAWKREHTLQNKKEKYEVTQADRKPIKFEMGGDASEHYDEVEYGEGGVARAKDVITNKIGYNEETADYFVGKSEKFAIWLADAILKEELKNKNYNKKQWLDSYLSSFRVINANYGGAIREILDWLQHPVTPKQELKQLSFQQALEKARDWHQELQVLGGDIDFTEPEKNTILKKYPKNDEGVEYYWVFIPSNYCDLESSRMGHCGRTGYGNNLISLRSVKPYGKGHTISDSHVTIAYGVTDGIFYQVKGKKNNKPAEKYFSFIYDLIKNSINDSINIDFNGFGSEYGDSEDYGYADMTTEELRELYELKPSLFNDVESIYILFDNGVIDLDELTKITEKEPELFSSYGNQMKLYDLGVISEKPSTTFELNYSCDEVYRLLDIKEFSEDIVDKILCGDFIELTDNWSYYYENPSDLVDNLNKENTERVIDEIVRITGYEKSVVEENGIEYYLNNEDENFTSDDFDNIIRVLASAQNNADQSDYYNYLYDNLKSSLEELGIVHSLNDEGVKMTIDLSNYMSLEEIAEGMDRYEFKDVADLFNEEIHNSYGGAIDRPKLIIDDRYIPYGSSQDFNEYVSDSDLESGFEKGGYLREKNTKKMNQMKINFDNNYAEGGEAGEWRVTDITDAEYLGIIEFKDNEGEFHYFQIMETDDRLVFGSMTNSGFIESGYIEKDGFSTDETLQSLLEDLEVYYNDGAEYTSQIVFNQRMAKGGGVGYEPYEMIVISKELDKDGGRYYKDRFLVSAKNIDEAKQIATDLWNENLAESDLHIVKVIPESLYKLKYWEQYAEGGGVGDPYDSMTKYQLEKTLQELTDEWFEIRKSYSTDNHPRQHEINKQKDKIITLLYGENFSGKGQKFKYADGGSTYADGVDVGGFKIVYETWSKTMGGNGVSGTIRTTPQNYYVATINEKGDIYFEDLEATTKNIDKKKVEKLWRDKKIPTSSKHTIYQDTSADFADGGEAGEWKIGDKFRVLKGIYGDYNSPRYANKEFEVINIRDGKYIDARTPRGTTETFDMKNIEKIKYANGGEVQDWMEQALDSLMEETGFDDLEITIVSDEGNEFIATDGDAEYRVFKTEDDAKETAIEQVREDLEENPEYFNKDFISNYIDGRDFFESALDEMNLGYAEDIKSEFDDIYANRLIQEMVENGILNEDDALSGNAEELANYYMQDFVNLMTEGQLDEGNDGLDYFISNFGEEYTMELVIDNNLIDVDEASRDAVEIDGIGHFLSSYDGETVYLSNDSVAYRIN